MMPPDARSTAAHNAYHARAIVTAMLNQGVSHAVVSPGSRNTPLVLALNAAATQNRIQCHVVLDERTAAFVALGIARTTHQPVVLSCTSGSAGGHYLPAMMEADRSGIQLIACTADRPEELQQRGAPQTTVQRALYTDYVRSRLDLAAPDGVREHATQFAVERCIAEGATQKGPVHLNLAFREPLWDQENEPIIAAPYPPICPRVQPGQMQANVPTLKTLVEREMRPQRGLIMIGAMDLSAFSDQERVLFRDEVQSLSQAFDWPVASDVIASHHGSPNRTLQHLDILTRATHPTFLDQIEHVLVLGPWPTSKAFGQWLDRRTELRVTSIPGTIGAIDPVHRVHTSIPGSLLQAVTTLNENRPALQKTNPQCVPRAVETDAILEHTIADFCTKHPLFEGSIARTVFECVDTPAIIHLASSMPIRDADAYAPIPSRDVCIGASRGVNGIDGNIATSYGEAIGSQRPTVLLIGDLAFRHDIGSIAAIAHQKIPLTIVVVNNGGGGIFRHLAIAHHPNAFETYFLTPQASTLEDLARGCGARVHRATDATVLSSVLQRTIKEKRVDVILIDVPGDQQPLWRKEAIDAALTAVDAARSPENSVVTHNLTTSSKVQTQS